MDITKLPYRMGAGIMLQNKDGKFFVGKRIDNPTEHWQMPQGGIDEGELPLDAARREMLEEIGTNNAELIHEHTKWIAYDVPEFLVPILWNGKYRGQKQRWFLFRFLGEDSEINLETDHPEFLEWKWTSLENLPNEIVPFKKDLYIEIVNIFRPFTK